MADLVERVVNFTIKKANGVPAADLDVFFIPKETAPGDNFIGSDLTVSARTNASGVGTATLYTYENSFLNYYAEWEGSGGRLEFTLADEVGDADLGELLAEAAQSEDLRFRVASTTVLGAVKIDGTTITIDADGVISSAGGGGAVDSVNGQTGVVVLDPDDLDDALTTHKFVTSAEKAAWDAKDTDAISALRNGVATEGDDLAKLYALITAINAIIGGSTPDGDALVDTVAELLEIFATYSEGVNIVTVLAGKQTSSSALTAIAGIAPSNDDIIQRKSGTWTNRTPAEFKTDLSLTKSDVGLSNVPNTDATARANHTGTQTASTISDFATTVLATALTGLGAGTNEAIASTDTILAAFAKLQNQIDNFSGGVTNSAGNNVIPKSDGTNLVASGFSNPSGYILQGETADQYLRLSNSAGTFLNYNAQNGFYAGIGIAQVLAGSNVYEFTISSLTGLSNPNLGTAGARWGTIFSLKINQLKSAAADPTTTEFPNDKDWGIHKNTSSGSVFLAYNDSGAIKKVALT